MLGLRLAPELTFWVVITIGMEAELIWASLPFRKLSCVIDLDSKALQFWKLLFLAVCVHFL